MKFILALITLLVITSAAPLSSYAQSISANAGANADVCAGSPHTLGGNPSASGGVGNYTYLWEPSSFLDDSLAANPTARPFVNTTYILTATDSAGNSAKDTVIISVDTIPVIHFSGVDSAYCQFGQRDTITITPVGGYSYGTGVMTNNVFDPFQAGAGVHFMKYLFTDNNGCVGLDSAAMNVQQPLSISFDPFDTVNCINVEPIPLNASPSGGTFGGPGIVNDTLYPMLAGPGMQFPIHYVITDSVGCMSVKELFHDVIDVPLIQFSGMPNPICTSDKVVILNATPPGGEFSGPFVHDGKFYVDSAGVGSHYIKYTVANKDSCWSTDSIDVTVIESPVAEFTSPGDSFCLSDAPVTLAGSPLPGTFSGPGVLGSGFDPATAGAGTHTLIYSHTASTSCVGEDSVVVFVSAGPTASIIDNGSFLTASGGTSYEWYFNGNLISGATSATHTPASSGNYHAKVFDAQSCFNITDTVEFVVNSVEALGNNTLYIYPNPGKDFIRIMMPDNEAYNLKINNTLGAEVLNIPGRSTRYINVMDLAKGLYIVSIETEQSNLRIKWLKD